MNRAASASFVLLLASIALSPLSAQPKAPLALVPSLDPGRYLGKWYEIARFQHGFEKGLVGVTA